ncbi:MAG: glycosyltransferase [Planctomycetota bacterium]
MSRTAENGTSTSVGVAIITHCAKHHLPRCLPPLLNSPLRPRVLVVNSSSGDGTVELAQELGAETLVIPRPEFNHGSTRERARKHLGTEFVGMVTPDAYAADEDVLGKLHAPLAAGEAAVSYARQIPHDGATFWESFPRDYNYPEDSQLRCLEDKDRYGIYTIFCSNAFAMYRNAALDEIGGFRPVLTHEDQFATAELLKRGHSIAYVAEAVVQHSHTYRLSQEFRRYFDTGYARKIHAELTNLTGSDQSRGRSFTLALLKTVAKQRPLHLPYALLQTGAKWMGYRLGAVSRNAPNWLKKACSGQDYYWTSTAYREGRSS